MPTPKEDRTYNTVKFEDGYIFRNSRTITSTPDLALTELIANAWDAGAYNVNIEIPEGENEIITIEDDGTGMTNDDFQHRWMTLNYNRQQRQGSSVVFPDDVESYKRMAYGRNGVGRHGMFCFAESYTLETWKDGICNKYELMLSSGEEPFRILKNTSNAKQGHGTKISSYVQKNIPDVANIIDIISARFVYDPRFTVKINGKKIQLSEHKGILTRQEIILESGVKLRLTIVNSPKTAQKSQQHGIAFWISWISSDMTIQ